MSEKILQETFSADFGAFSYLVQLQADRWCDRYFTGKSNISYSVREGSAVCRLVLCCIRDWSDAWVLPDWVVLLVGSVKKGREDELSWQPSRRMHGCWWNYRSPRENMKIVHKVYVYLMNRKTQPSSISRPSGRRDVPVRPRFSAQTVLFSPSTLTSFPS